MQALIPIDVYSRCSVARQVAVHKLELPLRGCIPLRTGEVAVYLRVCPDSSNIFSD